MEFDKFKEIRNHLCSKHLHVTEGKMMSSPAIHYNNKVFAFFSRKHKMVFKLGKHFKVDQINVELREFNPFKNKGPLSGWYEVDFAEKEAWEELAELALSIAKENS
ncbi:hypothetical protein HME9304_01573 [Flagellimonas maritima]|uniref:MmcQ/YjbR family DNA-binding protein n=1 Tax=Flagellimonas maritima TaxID=1383885 RepID=A0A2Z4LSA6_9FLAO|nr:hypothetical protein [Allomuricauda aurantiaca]AWX44570.1 hypothetical protein HME9304_01573 [Allomuricauda aurantiaca]